MDKSGVVLMDKSDSISDLKYLSHNPETLRLLSASAGLFWLQFLSYEQSCRIYIVPLVFQKSCKTYGVLNLKIQYQKCFIISFFTFFSLRFGHNHSFQPLFFLQASQSRTFWVFADTLELHNRFLTSDK